MPMQAFLCPNRIQSRSNDGFTCGQGAGWPKFYIQPKPQRSLLAAVMNALQGNLQIQAFREYFSSQITFSAGKMQKIKP
ncbi:hypothetical protein [Comamonas suwonensis]|uniref:Uncharacterized protein n=1 Tax=Comamonas suwonensis TaxID=2606214 RepID=A0A843B3T5_9BURK|nr:hypothetical protein [Comamonas suwonensis]MBI1625431.1 hypothetical protein [Comamonas suwonensis]